MNSASVQNALYVSQNGVLVPGTTQVTNNGQVVQFTPSAPFQANALIQVFLDPSAQDVNGNGVSSYQASFTVANTAATAPPALTGANPSIAANGIATNTAIDFAFSSPIDPNSLNPTSVQCRQNGIWLQSSVSLIGNGTIIHIVPRLLLPSNTTVFCYLSNGVLGMNGLATTGGQTYFTTVSTTDTVAPAISAISPPNGSTNVGDNAQVRVVFSKSVNPLTINASTIQLSVGGTTVVPDTITLSFDHRSVVLVPHAPLPDSTVVSLTITGITDVTGNPVPPQTTQFATGSGPDVVTPFAVRTNPFQGATNVPLNALITVQANEPIDPGSIAPTSFMVIDDPSGQNAPGSYTVSMDGQTVTFVPNPPLIATHGYHVYFSGRGITDLAGNSLLATSSVMDFTFTAGSSSGTSPLQVLNVSPLNGLTGVPINAQAVIQFNEAVDAATLAQVQLKNGSNVVNVTKSLSSANQVLSLVPALPLTTNTTYTVSIAGVQDLTGNPLGPPVTSNFTTSTQADLIAPHVVSATPGNSASGISPTTGVQVQFSEPIDPITLTNGTFQVYPQTTNIPVAGSITLSADRQTATFTPNGPLGLLTNYTVLATNGITDLAGQTLTYYQTYFTTAGTGSSGPPSITGFYPQPYGSAGATTAFINGINFGTSQSASSVTFNGTTATPTSWSDTQIGVPVPSAATTGPVVVTVNGVASNAAMYTVYNTPTVSNISPASGPAGTLLTISGTNFGSSYDQVFVQFNANIYGGLKVAPISWTPTSLTVAVPSAAIPGNIAVLVSGPQSNGYFFNVVPTPNILSVSPSSGITGTQVMISGSSFGPTQGSSVLYFNGVPAASIITWQDTYIMAVPPADVTSGPVTVVENSISSNSDVIFTAAPPTITSLSPPAAAPGATILVNGSGLTSQGITTSVAFNGVPAGFVTPLNSTSLSVGVPSNVTTGPVTVTVGTVTSNAVTFTSALQPTITDISPATGTAGSWPITITGSGFGATQSNSVLYFWGDVPATVISWSDTELKLAVPNGASTGPVSFKLGGTTTFGPSFNVQFVAQVKDSFNNQSTYTSVQSGGKWTLSEVQGPGCKSCSSRGDLQNTLDANGNILTTTDALGHTITYTFDSNNNVTSASKPLNVSTTATASYTYNSFGEALTMTDALGHVTTNTYDANGNLLTVTTPAPAAGVPASVTQFAYDSKGELTQITDPLNHVTTLTYTPAGLIQAITDTQNHTTSYGYDARGDRTSVTDALNHTTNFAYDIMGRLTGITYPDTSTISFGYDSRGRRTSATNKLNRTTTYTYDDANRLMAVTDIGNHVTQYTYDTESNLTSITDANNRTTSFAYNSRGWVTQTNFPSSLTEAYDYDAIGKLTSKTDRKGQTITYIYDALNRMTQKNYPDSTDVEYIYDLVGKVTHVNDPTGSYGFAYDNMGRLIGTTTQYTFLPSTTYTNSYSYDAASNRAGFTAPDGSTNTYAYDSLERLAV